jgi:hypothetical protein
VTIGKGRGWVVVPRAVVTVVRVRREVEMKSAVIATEGAEAEMQ